MRSHVNKFAVEMESRRDFGESLIQLFLGACATVSVLTTLGIIFVLLDEARYFFSQVSVVEFLTETRWTPLFTDKHFGIWPLLSGTLLTSGLALMLAVPLGLLAAIYLSELASQTTRKFLKPLLELLAGVPTVVYGFFALTVLTPFLQHPVPNLAGFNALSAGIVMGMMILPIVASLSEDALGAVPRLLRENAAALGATRLTILFRITLPTAFSGIAAAILLSISRAVGETMIVAIASGQQPRFTFDPRVPIETMTAYIAQVSMGDTPQGTLEYQTIFAVGLALFAITFVFNIFAHRLKQNVLGKGGL